MTRLQAVGTLPVMPDAANSGQAIDTRKGRWIVVDLQPHVIHVYNDGSEVRKIEHFSVGRLHHQTPLYKDVHILPDKRFTQHQSTIYHASMPYSLFFDQTRAFHQGDVTVESHGCVHLSKDDAHWLFHWVGKHDVHVRFIGPYSHKHVRAHDGSNMRYA